MAPPVILALSPYATSWLDLLLRWLHVVAAIVWIGTSFYFIALDSHLLPAARERDRDDGVGGEAWEIHGGGFYLVQKYRVAPPELPQPLHWFKWEAYTTWLSGFALLIVLYYLHADVYLIDPSVADLSTGAAIGASLGLLAGGWLVYDALCRLLEDRERLLAAAIAALTVAVAYGSSRLFSGRGSYLEVGAVLGTIMAANVLFVIIPAHWDVVRAKREGRAPEPRPGLHAKQRSVHNNYLTLPVVFAMLGNHFAIAYGHDHAWLILLALMAVGVWVRYFFNLHHQGRDIWAIPVTAALAIAGIAVWIRPGGGAVASGPSVTAAQATAIVQRRCVPCHSEHPTNPSFSTAPAGIELDTLAEIKARAAAIDQQAVVTRAMPLGNATGMTDSERQQLGRWLRSLGK
jgi:uncharacterized membrane protein